MTQPNISNDLPAPPRRTVLLVEDDPLDVDILRLAFSELKTDVQLIAVPNGREAIHYICRLGEYADEAAFPKPFLVLLDLSLPIMSGFDFLAWMQGEPAANRLPVVVLSYSRLEQDRQLAAKFGAEEYFVKSPDLNETIALVRNLLLKWVPLAVTTADVPGSAGEIESSKTRERPWLPEPS